MQAKVENSHFVGIQLYAGCQIFQGERLGYGDVIKVNCDGCPADITAHISFIASAAEFTPPVIYSLEERSKLVFLIEALPSEPGNLRVGQPVDVALPGREARP